MAKVINFFLYLTNFFWKFYNYFYFVFVFSYRFPDYFPHTDLVKEVQFELDNTIREGIVNLVTLIKNSSKLPGDTLALPKMKALLSEEDTEKEKGNR